MSGWWEDDPLAPATDPAFTGYIPGTPKAPKAYEPPSGYTGSPDHLTPIPGGPADKPGTEDDPQKAALRDAINGLGLEELMTGVQRAREAVKTGWATGAWGALAELKPGGATTRDDFKSYVTQIQGGIINEKLAALKEASKTGASGMGALSEKEGERLASAVAAVNDQMSPEALDHSFSEIERHVRTLQAVRDGKDPSDPNVRREYHIGGTTIDDGAGPPGTGPAPGTAALSDDQKQAYAAFIDSFGGKPPPGPLKSFLEKLTGKTVTNAEDIADAIAQGRGVSSTVEDRTYEQKLRDRMSQEREVGLSEDSPATTLVDQAATLNLSDEAAGVGNAAANVITAPFTGNFDPAGAYRTGRDMERLRVADARDKLGWGGTALELAGGLAALSPANAVAAISPRAAGASGALAAGISGFGSGEGAEESGVRAAIGAPAGYVLGRYAPNAVEKLFPRRLRSPQGMAPEVADAAAAEGVDLMRPMVDPSSVSEFGALESNIYSQPIIRGATARIRGQIEDRAAALGGDGTPLDTEAAGTAVQGSGRRFIERSRQVANTLYNRARALAGDATVTPRAALGQLRQEIQALSETPAVNQGEIDFINELGEDLTRGPLSVDAIRNLRASIRGRISQSGLTATQAEARASRIIDALQTDVQKALPPAAATAYRRADLFYRERMTHIDDIISRFLGPRDKPLSGEQAFKRLQAMAAPGGDNRRMAALMRGLDPAERQDVAATIASNLGRRAPDEPFSSALFLSQTRKFSPRALRTLFGADGAQSVENLRLLSQRLEQAGQDINRSRSATVLERQGIRTAARAFISGLAGIGGTAATGSVSGGLAGMAVAGGAMGASAARRVLSARAMVNPRVSRWLAEAADVSTRAQAEEMKRRLGVIIAREPSLARELQSVYEALQQRLTPRLAAQPEGDDDE